MLPCHKRPFFLKFSDGTCAARNRVGDSSSCLFVEFSEISVLSEFERTGAGSNLMVPRTQGILAMFAPNRKLVGKLCSFHLQYQLS